MKREEARYSTEHKIVTREPEEGEPYEVIIDKSAGLRKETKQDILTREETKKEKLSEKELTEKLEWWAREKEPEKGEEPVVEGRFREEEPEKEPSKEVQTRFD